MSSNKVDILCNQVIDIALVVKEAKHVISESKFLTSYPERFGNRVDSVVAYVKKLYDNANNHSEEEINDLMIDLMHTLVKYKNSYPNTTYGYKVMNSLLDITKDIFVELNGMGN